MIKPMEIQGSKIDWEKYEKLQSEYWEKIHSTLHCKKHSTFFDGITEPCWRCWEECEVEL
uniref:Uncharacterized protein n=1 Tax=viral metagenome TaxID=1070528 RepID=A0A6M3K8J2_9ZZZZ